MTKTNELLPNEAYIKVKIMVDHKTHVANETVIEIPHIPHCSWSYPKDDIISVKPRQTAKRLNERKLMAWIAVKYNVTKHQAMVYAQDILNEINSGELWE